MSEPTARSLLRRTWVLLIVNLALLAWGQAGGNFMPSQEAIALGFVYGFLCASWHVHTIRLARRRIADLDGPDRDTERKKIEKPWLVGALAQMVFGMVGFTEGIASLYTAELGRRDEVTYVVFDVVLHPNRGRCYKHKFADVSWLQNFFSGPCLKVEYAPGTRFHYRGHSSWLGFKEDGLDIEPERPPAR